MGESELDDVMLVFRVVIDAAAPEAHALRAELDRLCAGHAVQLHDRRGNWLSVDLQGRGSLDSAITSARNLLQGLTSSHLEWKRFESELDFGLALDPERQVMRSLSLPSTLLGSAGTVGVRIKVSFYIASAE